MKNNVMDNKVNVAELLKDCKSGLELDCTIYNDVNSHYNDNKFYGCGMCCNQCIPYEGNEHLINTTNDCDNFFRVWEEY
jgi:hypothetical protein